MGVVFKMFVVFITISKLCLALGLSVSWTYVWHWVCLLVKVMFSIGFVCLFVGLMFGNSCVIWNKHG